MGNQLRRDVFSNGETRETKHVTNLWRSISIKIKSKLKTTRKTNAHSRQHDDFIIKYNRRNQHNENHIDINSLDQRRIVFVSLIGFYQTWRKCPSFILHTCLLMLPLKRKWIYNPDKYINDIKSCFISQLSIFANSDEIKINYFIELLKWKDSQCLILWMLDDEEEVRGPFADRLVAPFWYSLSKKLTTLSDPVTRDNYRPLNLDHGYWQNKKHLNAKYDVDFLAMKFKSMKEIISDSNPNSLHPIMFYEESNDISQSHKKMSVVYEEFEAEEVDDWWISEDYNPNDIHA